MQIDTECEESEGKTYDLMAVDETPISHHHVRLYPRWGRSRGATVQGIQLHRKADAKRLRIRADHIRRPADWARDRKGWEIRLVFRVWDNESGRAPPYVTRREQLGDVSIDIPQEWQETAA